MKKTLRNIVAILCLNAFVLPVHAQAMWALLFGKKIHNDKLSLGVHLALAASDLTKTESNLLPGISFGAYTNLKFSNKLTLSNYFIFKSSRGANDVPLAYQIQPNVPGAENATIRRKLTYIEISPLMRYNLTPELSLAAGPQLAARTVAKDIYRQTLGDGGKEILIYKIKDNINWFDFSAAADIQYAFYKGKGIRLNFRFSQGFTNVYKDPIPFQAKNQYFQLGVGIPIATGSDKQ